MISLIFKNAEWKCLNLSLIPWFITLNYTIIFYGSNIPPQSLMIPDSSMKDLGKFLIFNGCFQTKVTENNVLMQCRYISHLIYKMVARTFLFSAVLRALFPISIEVNVHKKKIYMWHNFLVIIFELMEVLGLTYFYRMNQTIASNHPRPSYFDKDKFLSIYLYSRTIFICLV